MRITSSGSVGIGTSSPSAPLTVQTSSTTNLDIKSTATNGTAQARFSNDARTYSLGIDGSDSFFVYDATGTSTRMTITSAGDLLVGKASADFGSARGVELRPTGNSYFTNADGNALRLNRLNSDGEILTFRKDGADVGIIGTTSSNAYISGTTRGLHFTGTAGIIPCNEAGASRDADTDLGKSSTRFKDLYLSGDVFVNKTTKTAAGSGILLDGNGFAYFVRDGAVQILLGNDDTGGTSQEAIRFVRASSDVGSIDTTSTSTAYNTSSDYRLKTDAQPMTGATDRIKQLNPVNFEWVANGTRVDGFLAHEAQAVVPEAVTGAKDAMRDEEYEVTPAVTDDDGNVVTEAVMGTRSVPDYQGIDQSKLVPLLVATIQELEARITALENA
jgi:hypothetical protein